MATPRFDVDVVVPALGADEHAAMPSVRTGLSVAGVTSAAGFVVACCTALAFLGSWGWLFDLMANFRLQYFASAAVVALFCLLDGRRRVAAALGAVAAVNLAVILPFYVPAETHVTGPTTPLRLMSVNVFVDNQDFATVVDSVRRENPDVVLFSEVDHTWFDRLKALASDYPHVTAKPRYDNFGIALFSRIPFREAGVVHLGTFDVPSIVAELALPTGVVTVLGTHPPPPVDPFSGWMRDEQLATLALFMRALPTPAVLLGDLNTTPWSDRFRRLLADAALTDSMRGFGPQPSWPTDIWALSIPIDHCLHSTGVRTVDRRLGVYNGSDHYPLVVDLEVGAR